MFDPITLLTAGIPILTEGGKALIDIVKNRFTPDQVKPANVGELIQMQEAQIKLFQAMNIQGGDTFPWVEAIIKLQRPLVVSVIMAIWATAHLTTGADTGAADNAAAAVGFYLFADRTLFYTRKATK